VVETVRVPLKEIQRRKELQVRLNGINTDTVGQYAVAMQEGEVFPPIVVFEVEDGALVLTDGYHRYEALKKSGADEASVELRKGTYEEALDYARFTANRKNGQRLSRADLWALLESVLTDPRHRTKSDQTLAKLCGCTAPTVAAARDRVGVQTSQRVGADGRVRSLGSEDRDITEARLGHPPAGPEAQKDGGEGALTKLLLQRLQDHLKDLGVSVSKLGDRAGMEEQVGRLQDALQVLENAVGALEEGP
jgi:hypothetical protein